MNDVPLIEIIKHGWPVLSVLVIMSVISVTIIADRWMMLSSAKINGTAFVARVVEYLKRKEYDEAIAFCQRFADKPLSRVIMAVIKRRESRDAMGRAMGHAVDEEVRTFEKSIHILGTVAGTAPFVGLFGTVIGIIKSFADIAANAGGGPEVVASGIAEALTTTAFGLLVAIPAVMMFNFFVQKIQHLVGEIEHCVYHVVETLAEGK